MVEVGWWEVRLCKTTGRRHQQGIMESTAEIITGCRVAHQRPLGFPFAISRAAATTFIHSTAEKINTYLPRVSPEHPFANKRGEWLAAPPPVVNLGISSSPTTDLSSLLLSPSTPVKSASGFLWRGGEDTVDHLDVTETTADHTITTAHNRSPSCHRHTPSQLLVIFI